MNWPPPRPGDVAAFLLVLAIVGILLFKYALFPSQDRTVNAGLGPEWDCTYPGKGEPICIKKRGEQPAKPNQSTPPDPQP